MQCAISAIADHLNFMTFENHCYTSIENAFADFEIRVAYFGTDRGTKQETVTQASIICKCALSTQRVHSSEAKRLEYHCGPFTSFFLRCLSYARRILRIKRAKVYLAGNSQV